MGRKIVTGGAYKPTIALTRGVKDQLAGWLEKNNRPEQSLIVGKIITWFLEQPPIVQGVVLGTVPQGLESAYATVLRELADQAERKREPTPDFKIKSGGANSLPEPSTSPAKLAQQRAQQGPGSAERERTSRSK